MKALLLASAIALSCGQAQAQTTPPTGNVGVAEPAPRFESPNTFEQDRNSARLNEQANSSQSPRRVRRAERAAAMINTGDCEGALALAVNEGDTRLADAIRGVCTPQAQPGS